MPRKRKRSVSPSTSAVRPAIRGGSGMDEGRNDISIQQGPGSISQSGRSNPRSHSSIHEHDAAMISPRQHQRQRHSPPQYQPPPYEQQQQQQQQRNPAYSPPPPTPSHQSSYHPTHRNSPDREEHPSHSPSNPHAPSHYNFANRAYAQQRDSGFNTFRVNPGPVAGGSSNPVPPVPLPIASPLPTPSSEDSFQYRYRPHSHSQPPPPTAAAPTPIPPGSSYTRLSPPPRDIEIENDIGRSGNTNGSGFKSNRGWGRNGGGEISLSSSDEDDIPYNPVTAGGRSKAMVKYLIMKAKYRYVLDERTLLADELESLKREEHEQWTLKEVGVDEIFKSFGSDSDRFLHDRNDQQYQLHHHDQDSADGDMDLLRDLDKERHAFLNQRDRGRERKEYVNDIRGRDHHSNHHVRSAVDLDRNGSEDTVSGGRQRRRSSSRSRSRLEDSHSNHHYSRHPYRRTPPPLSSTSERERQHTQQASSSSFSQQDTRPYVPELVDTGQDGQRYLSSPHPPQQYVHAGRGLISPPSSQQRQSRYQSPPLPSQHRTPPPPIQYRESPERRRNHEESLQPPGESRDGGLYGSNTSPVNNEQREREMRTLGSMPSSSSSRTRHSPHISHSSHSPDGGSNSRLYIPETSRERETESSTRPKRGRPSLEESARERDFETSLGSTSTNSNTTVPMSYEHGREYSPSPPSDRSVTPQHPATPKQPQTQTQQDSMEATSARSRSRTLSIASLSQGPPPNSNFTQSSRSAQAGGSPPLRSMSLAATVNPNFLPPSSTPIRKTTTTPPHLSNSQNTAPVQLSNDSPSSPHRSVGVHSPLVLQKDATSIIKDERDVQVGEREDGESGRTLGRGSGMDIDVD